MYNVESKLTQDPRPVYILVETVASKGLLNRAGSRICKKRGPSVEIKGELADIASK